jgi:hypothetical protein
MALSDGWSFVQPRGHRTALSRFLEGRTAGFYHFWFCVILAVGTVMDYYLTGLWLPRAGAIVAGVAAYVYFFDPRTTDDWWLIRQNASPAALAALRRETLETEENPDPSKSRAASIARRQALEQTRIVRGFNKMAEARKITYREAKAAHQRAHDMALRVQAYWLFVGTLIWAFGDIPVELLKCGQVPC